MRMKLSSAKTKARQSKKGIWTEKDEFYTINASDLNLYGLLMSPIAFTYPILFYGIITTVLGYKWGKLLTNFTKGK